MTLPPSAGPPPAALPGISPVELIRKKRNGGALSRPEIEGFVGAYLRGDVADYQMSALLMAVYFRGMDEEETSILTDVMLRSGTVIDLSAVPGRKVDKHSTGGVGDKVSLILAPMVAACGVPVPMISGRGLAHTGGTLDKLEAIPGFRTRLTVEEYRSAVAEVGVALAGQTEEVAPADRRMYALRDVTATVESVPLIAGSIMSKKLAAGIDALVLDIKTGEGAFMASYDDAAALGQTLVGIGARAGKETLAFITTMDQPLGLAVGNWVEVREAVECLRGRAIPDLMEVTYVLGGAMLWLGGRAGSIAEGMKLCRTAVWSGRAYDKLLEVVARQGGDVGVVERPESYPPARHSAELRSDRDGYLAEIGARRVGLLAAGLGAGRMKVDDAVDPAAGIVLRKKVGDRVARNDVLAVLHTARAGAAEAAAGELSACMRIDDAPPPRRPRVLALVDREGVRPWTTPEQY